MARVAHYATWQVRWLAFGFAHPKRLFAKKYRNRWELYTMFFWFDLLMLLDFNPSPWMCFPRIPDTCWYFCHLSVRVKTSCHQPTFINHTWWLIPLSKWVITPVINGISRVNPLITGVISHLLSGMSHQVMIIKITHTIPPRIMHIWRH